MLVYKIKKKSVCEKTICSVFLCVRVQVCFSVLCACLTPFYHSSRSGSIPKGLILQVNLSFSQQQQTWQWEKSTLPWWSWSTTDRARSSARRPFVMSRYCCLALAASEPFTVKHSMTHWNQGCKTVVPFIKAWVVATLVLTQERVLI